jgi:hypothetical protein
MLIAMETSATFDLIIRKAKKSSVFAPAAKVSFKCGVILPILTNFLKVNEKRLSLIAN